MVAEAQIMQKLVNHPNLVQFYRWSRDTHGTEYMIMELIGNGSLDQLLRSGSPLTVAQKLKVRPQQPGGSIALVPAKLIDHCRCPRHRQISEQICDAMCELCNKELLHGDLAARNVLVSSTSPIHVKVRLQRLQLLGMADLPAPSVQPSLFLVK